MKWAILVLGVFCWLNVENVISIDCFKCKSFDKQNPSCDDPFEGTNYTVINNNKTESLLVTNCYTGESGKTLVVRDCALDSGGLNADTELVRIQSQCGHFFLDGAYIEGCVQSCNTDACNGSIHPVRYSTLFFYMASIFQITFTACLFKKSV